jgi:hypothetical protein
MGMDAGPANQGPLEGKTGMDRERARGEARIFVRLAAYRDAECEATVEDALAKAAHPDRVFFGICWQFQPGTDPAVPVRNRLEQVRFVRVPAGETLGVCWARYQAEQLWRGEDYSLQVDSHSRFAPGWDELLITELAQCDSPKPLLSTSPAGYRPPDLLEANPPLYVRSATGFNDDGTIRFSSHALEAVPAEPVPCAFLAAGFVFSRGELLQEVPYDPHLYFGQEETAYSVRVFTHGWDLFSPTRVIVYHYYNQSGASSVRPLHWSDNAAWWRLDQLGRQRFQHMTGTRRSTDPPVIVGLDRFGLGHARTLGQYEDFAGINFCNRSVLDRASRGQVTNKVPSRVVPLACAPAPAAGVVATPTRPNAQLAPHPRDEAPLREGAFLPPLALLDCTATSRGLQGFAGAPTALFLLPATELSGYAAFFEVLARHEEALRGLQRIYLTPLPLPRLKIVDWRLGLGGALWSDPGRRASRLLGACLPGSSTVRLTTCLLGPNLRVIETWHSGDLPNQLRRLADAAAPWIAEPRDAPLTQHAPVLLVPGVLTPIERSHLAERAHTGPGQHPCADDAGLDNALSATLFPEIVRVFGIELGRAANYAVIRAAPGEAWPCDASGHSAPDAGTGRRFAVDINLGDDYEGGEILFPEYGAILYRPPAGTALVSPCSIIRRRQPVTAGSCCRLTFFIGEAVPGADPALP